jgi:hypothetical protein
MAMSRFRGCFPGKVAIRAAALLVLLLLVASCKGGGGSTTPTTPSGRSLDVSGNWSAVLTGLDAASANGRLAVTFDHRHLEAERGLLLGTWSLTAPDQSSTKSGTVSGVVAGAVGLIDLVPTQRPACANALDAAIAGVLSLNVAMAAERLGGTISAYMCGVKFDSTIELRR